MGIRLTIGGIQVECDTPDEASGIIRACSQGSPRKPPTKQKPRKKINRQELLFANDPGRLLILLKESFPGSLTGINLAKSLNCGPKSLPALFVSLRNRFKKCGYDFNELVARRQSYERGKPISTYTLTEKAINDLPWPEIETKALNVNGGSEIFANEGTKFF